MPPGDVNHTLATPDDEVPEQPMVIAWETLDADTYRTTVRQLAAWVDWLVDTYEPPTQVIPPCWYAHPAQLEELGHLWTGWLITRHPLSGVGMIGLDWDTRRDHTFQRLRETVAATGCNARNHNPPTPTMPRTNPDGLKQHLHDSDHHRQQADLLRRRRAAAAAVLTEAELRHTHAPAVLRQVTTEPASATDHDRARAAQALQDAATTAVHQAQRAAASATVTPSGTDPEGQLRQAREALTTAIAQNIPPRDLDQMGTRWAAALQAVVPAEQAIDRAAAAAIARKTAAGRLAADHRHPDARDLIERHEEPQQ